MKMGVLGSCGLMSLVVAFSASVFGATPSLEEMWKTIQEQQQEIAELKAQLEGADQALEDTNKKLSETDEKVEATADALESGLAVPSGSAKAAEWATKTSIGGYGEHHYNAFDDSDDKVDAHRYVLFISHEYSDSVRFFSELELEHSLAGDGKPGEVELEQAYIEWDYSPKHSLQLGQFLVPVGILNDTHEPETFYGVERNLVEKNIIPTTWWETGLMFKGEIAPNLSYNFAVHSGLDTSSNVGNIRSGRQKSAKAIANSLAYTTRVKYTGVRGLELGATLQLQDDIAQEEESVDTASATLFEAHAAYKNGGFGLRALWANWSVDGVEAESNGRDEQTGWYLEPSYKFNEKVGVFVRYSSWDNTAGLAGSDANEVTDFGVNYWLNPRVVLKADYQDAGDYNDNNSLNLGVGWSF